MSLAHLQLLEMASKGGPRVADKAGLELLFNFPFLIIKNQYMGITSLLVSILYIKTKRWQAYGGVWNSSGPSHDDANILYGIYLLHSTDKLK